MSEQINSLNYIEPNETASKKRPLFLLALLLLAILIIPLSLYLIKITSISPSDRDVPKLLENKINKYKIIAKVGEEEIFQSDYDQETFNNPKTEKEEIIYKLVEDSIILQGARTDNYALVDFSVFNSPVKDYNKRLKLIEEVKKNVNSKISSSSGEVISIRFYNLGSGKLGYEKSKELAFSKISKVYSDVKNKKITIKQAGNLLKNDKEIPLIDPNYKLNSYMTFIAVKNKPITLDYRFDTILRQLGENEISELYLAKDESSNQKEMVDAVYMFGQITNITEKNRNLTFNEWLSQKKQIYEIKYY